MKDDDIRRAVRDRDPACEYYSMPLLFFKGFQALQAHQGDTGGKDAGGFSIDATEIYAEGLAIPVLKLVHRGETRRDVLEMLILPTDQRNAFLVHKESK